LLFEDADTTYDTVGDEWYVTAVSALRLSNSERECYVHKSEDTRTVTAFAFLTKREMVT
jgi:hypothetical protein